MGTGAGILELLAFTSLGKKAAVIMLTMRQVRGIWVEQGGCVSRDWNRLLGRRSFIIKQMPKPRPDIARFVEMPGHATGAAAD
jgi:hypothetical protein